MSGMSQKTRVERMEKLLASESRYPAGFARFDLLGMSQSLRFEHVPDFTEAIELVAARLNRNPRDRNAHGDEREIIAAVCNPEQTQYAWVEYRFRELETTVDIQFYLRAVENGKQVTDWIIETYNPFFGCQVQYLAWHEDRIVIIYQEKHHVYMASLRQGKLIQRLKINHEWQIRDGVLLALGSAFPL